MFAPMNGDTDMNGVIIIIKVAMHQFVTRLYQHAIDMINLFGC